MKRKIWAYVLCLAIGAGALPLSVSGQVGDMSFTGGTMEGARLPKTTDVAGAKKPTPTAQPYKELTLLSGRPVVIDGMLLVTGNAPPTPVPAAAAVPVPAPSATPKPKASDTSGASATPTPAPTAAAAAKGGAAEAASTGTFATTQNVSVLNVAGQNAQTAQTDTIQRNISFNVSWRRVGTQLIENFTVRSWSETINVDGGSYTIIPGLSHYDVSSLTHQAAGVSYYKADISARAVYQGADGRVTVETTGQVFGYDCPWSSTETQRLDVQVMGDTWQARYQVRPSVSVNKTLQYSSNEPTAISFEGNYREVTQNQSGLTYDVSVLPARFWDAERHGAANLATYNSFEQLPHVDTAFLKSHPAEADITKLFSMGILSGDPKLYQPAQAITRSEFVQMLTKAIKLPVNTGAAASSSSKKATALPIVFPDVQPERADYAYIMAAYNAGIAIGRGNGFFHADMQIEREEAFALALRALGLSNLGLDPTPMTAFTDDAKIAAWARRDLYAARRIDLIRADDNGAINPKGLLTKAEAAALINRMVDYMREGLQLDYTEHIVNYGQ